MIKNLSFFSLGICLLFASAIPASATTIVWQDTDLGLRIKYPDQWTTVVDSRTDHLLTIAAPAGKSIAQCRFFANKDGRFGVYPHRYDFALMQAHFGMDYWYEALQMQSRSSSILHYKDFAGLGRSYATAVVVDYTPLSPENAPLYTALMTAGHYDGVSFSIECRARSDQWENYRGLFNQILSHTDHAKTRHELLSGHYRPFHYDGTSWWVRSGLANWFRATGSLLGHVGERISRATSSSSSE